MHGRVGIGAQVLLTEGCSFVHLGYADQHVILAMPLPCLPRVRGGHQCLPYEALVDQFWGLSELQGPERCREHLLLLSLLLLVLLSYLLLPIVCFLIWRHVWTPCGWRVHCL